MAHLDPAALAIGFGIWSAMSVLKSIVDRQLSAAVPATVAVLAVGFLLVLPLIEFMDPDYDPLTVSEVELIENARSSSSRDEVFLVVSSDDLVRDNFLEWFSFLAERTVLNQRWGAEFLLMSRELDSINENLQQCESVTCLAGTDLFDEADPASRRFVVIHPGVAIDSPDYSVIFQNESGAVVELP